MTSPWPGFVLVAIIGWWLRDRLTAWRLVGASLVGSVVFFIASNFMLWITGALYPVTMGGLRTCLIQAIPFFRNTVVGDLVYAAVFVGVFEFFRARKLAEVHASGQEQTIS